MTLRLLVTAASGWLLVLLLALTIRIPYRSRPRMPWHYRLGYGIGALTLAHGWAPMTPAIVRHADRAGLGIATAAFLLVLLEIAFGLWLRRRPEPKQGLPRHVHFWIMAGIVALAAIHIGLDSSALGTFRP